jgi:hypothetical protein
MDNVLNLVYDDWPLGQEFPNANRPKDVDVLKKQYDINSPWEVSYKTMSNFKNVVISNHKIDDIGKFTNKKFFYHIWHRAPLVDNFFDKGILPVDKNIIDLIKNNKNLYLIFMNEVEVESKISLEKLNNILISNNIDASKVWVINNNQQLDDWKTELNTNINVHSCRLLPQMFLNECPTKWKLDKESGSFFMCHNRSPREHRYALLVLLKKYGLLSDTNWSLINGWQSDKSNPMIKYSSIFTSNDLVELSDEINYFENIDTFKSKYELDFINFDDRINQIIFNNTKSYENSYVNITTETNFQNEVIHISEKSFKPFYYFQFPLILASYHHIKYLKKVYKFDLFEDIINYDYDNIKNNRDRLFAFIEEVNRIHNNKELFIKFYKNNKERFIKNHNILAHYKNEYDYNFFKQLAQ